MDTPPFTVHDARYAKGMKLVRCATDGSGYKTRANRLAEALRGRYTHRESGYVMSPTKVAKLEELFSAGWDANFFSKVLIPPKAD